MYIIDNNGTKYEKLLITPCKVLIKTTNKCCCPNFDQAKLMSYLSEFKEKSKSYQYRDIFSESDKSLKLRKNSLNNFACITPEEVSQDVEECSICFC